jgi:hypothetical protein
MSESDWEKYYQYRDILPFGTHFSTYKAAFDHLSSYSDVLNRTHLINALLCGFHPNNGSLRSFIDFCQRIHPNPDDNLFAIDMNPQPFEAMTDYERQRVSGMQIPLERLSDELPEKTIDVAFLDYILDLMDAKTVKDSFSALSGVITPNGLLLATINDPLIPTLYNFFNTLRTGAQYHAFSYQTIIALAHPCFKPVFVAESKPSHYSASTLVVFAKPKSPYPHDNTLWGFD